MELFEVIDQKLVDAPPVGGNITQEALDRKWIKQFGAGQYVYGTEWTKLLRRLQELLLERAAGMGFSEQTFPRMIPAQALDDFKLTQFKPDLLWKIDDGQRVLDPVQCLPFYHSLRESEIDVADLPLKVVETIGGWTWRKEREEELDGVFRAKEFLRFEHVWLGTPEVAKATRKQVLSSVSDLLSELGLSVQTVVGEGCMPIPEVTQRTLDAKVPDDVPVIDIELRVRPAQSADELTKADFDEIAGCTIEGNHHLESFGIASTTGEELWSGCCGVGLNRLIIAFLFQHGFDSKNWPALVTKGLAL